MNEGSEAAPELVAALKDLLARTELRDIRLQALSGEVLRTPPEEMTIGVTPSTPRFARDEGAILALFSHRVDYSGLDTKHPDAGDTPVSHVEVTHLVEIALQGDDAPSDESVAAFLGTNVRFMVYPYVRAALHRLPAEFDLPPLFLLYLRRDTLGVILPDTTGDSDAAAEPAKED